MHFDFSRVLQEPYISWLLDGLQVSLLLFAFAWLIAFSLAVVLTLIRLTEIKPLVFLVASYVEIGRSVPLLVQVFFWYFAASSLLPHAVDRAITRIDPEFIYAGIAFGLGMAAYLSEVLRSGIRSIPHTQIEAGRALGFGWFATMRIIVLPQAFRATVPPLLNYTLMLFKNTSVALAIGVKELTYQTRLIENTTFATFEIFALTTLIYLTGSLLLTVTGEMLERHWNHQGSGT